MWAVNCVGCELTVYVWAWAVSCEPRVVGSGLWISGQLTTAVSRKPWTVRCELWSVSRELWVGPASHQLITRAALTRTRLSSLLCSRGFVCVFLPGLVAFGRHRAVGLLQKVLTGEWPVLVGANDQFCPLPNTKKKEKRLTTTNY